MDRIQKIRNHRNYWALPRVDEFWSVQDRIASIDKSGGITEQDEIYLAKVEKELERLNPGKRLMIIEGKSELVDTLYLGSDG